MKRIMIVIALVATAQMYADSTNKIVINNPTAWNAVVNLYSGDPLKPIKPTEQKAKEYPPSSITIKAGTEYTADKNELSWLILATHLLIRYQPAQQSRAPVQFPPKISIPLNPIQNVSTITIPEPTAQ